MKRITKLAFACVIALNAVLLASCSKDGGDGDGGEAIENGKLIGKWEARSNTLGIVSVEFGVSGNYIVVADGYLARAADESEPTVYFGTYRIDGDEIILSDLATVTVKLLSGNSISITVNTEDSGTVNITASKAQEMPASTKTDLLCRTWKIVNDETNYPDDDDDDDDDRFDYFATVYFSKAGTYLLSYRNEAPELSNWKWKSETSGVIYYSWEFPPVWKEDQTTVIETLTTTSLVIYEEFYEDYNGDGVEESYYDRVYLEPVAVPATRSGHYPVTSTKGTSGRGFLGR